MASSSNSVIGLTAMCMLAIACDAQRPTELDTSTSGQATSASSTAPTSSTTASSATSDASAAETSSTTSSTTGDAGTDTTFASTTDESGDGSSSDSSSGGPTTDPYALIGWANAAGSGLETTTGGEGGPMVMVDSIDELRQFAESDDPHIIMVSGQLEGDVNIGSNTTIRGMPGASIHGELRIVGNEDAQRENVILANLTLRGNACDGGCDDRDVITVRYAHHIWIDHCDIADGDDGNLDITLESDFITVSWSRFSYVSSDRPHRYSNLIGHADDFTEDADDLGVTLHHNWWAENVAERMPRARFGQIHVFNNYYASSDSNYCIRAATDANLRIENNYFDGVDTPIDPSIHEGARVTAVGNISNGGGLFNTEQGEAFDPPYDYTLDDAPDVRSIVMLGAGPQ